MSVEAQGPAAAPKEITAISDAKDNGGLIARANRLGYIESPVLDLTYGDGAFWSELRIKYTYAEFASNDKFKKADFDYDFRCTDFPTGYFSTVVFDPPFKLAGTPASGDMDDAYGTDVGRTRSEIYALLVGGMAEASRLTKKWLLVKTMDMVSSGQVRWQCDIATDVARALEFRKVDSLHLKGGRPQPEGRRQVHARRNYSSLLVFKRGQRR